MYGFNPFGFNGGNFGNFGGFGNFGNFGNMFLLNIFQNLMNSNLMDSVAQMASSGMFNAAMKETTDEYYIGANLQGIDPKDVNINQNNNNITISIIRRGQNMQNLGGFLGQQNICSQMARSFYVENGNMDLIKIGYENGLLLIKIPKTDAVSFIDTSETKLIELGEK